jgi:hypothetical protein
VKRAEIPNKTPLLGGIAQVVSVSTLAVCCLSACATDPAPATPAAGSGVVMVPGSAGTAAATVQGAMSAAGATAGAAAGTAGMAAVSGAAGSGGSPAMGSPPTAEKGAPAWSAIFRDIIVAKGCQGASLCHGGPAGMLMMATRKAAYNQLVGKAAAGMAVEGMACAATGLMRVAPGDPDNSLFMQKVLGTQTCGAVMPPNPPMLEPAEIEQIRMWIANGAMDN